MIGMIWLAIPSCPPIWASVRFRSAGTMSAAWGTNFSSAVVAVAPRSASFSTAVSLPSTVRASWKERMAGVNTPSRRGLPATAAAPAAMAGSTAIRSGWASRAATATAWPISVLTASSWRISFTSPAKFSPLTTAAFNQPRIPVMNSPIAPSVSSTVDQVLLRRLFMTASPRDV